MATVTRGGFAKRLLNALDAPVSQHNLLACVTWESAEGARARFNPLATTRQMTGATNFNPIGVKDYPNLSTGVEATRLTLVEHGHNYEPIVANLRANSAAKKTLEAVAASDWGTGRLALSILADVKADYENRANVPIGQ